MTGWIAIGNAGNGKVIVCALRNGRLLNCIKEANEPAALERLGFDATRILRIGEGVPDKLPAAVLPEKSATLPGMIQDNPPEVIGAWVRVCVAGFLAKNPGWDGIVCIVHSGVNHWMHVSADEIVSCQGFLTPRLIAALKGRAAPDPQALADSLSRPEKLAAHLRQAEITQNKAAISGHLIGAELAAARPYWLGQQVTVMTETRDPGYVKALNAQGVSATALETKNTLEAGLAAVGRVTGFCS